MSGYVPNLPKGYRYEEARPVDIHAENWAQRKGLPSRPTKPDTMDCVFAKSWNLPGGEINHKNSAGFVPVEKQRRLWAVGGTWRRGGNYNPRHPNTNAGRVCYWQCNRRTSIGLEFVLKRDDVTHDM